MAMRLAAEAAVEQQRWAGAELLVCAVIQLLLVNVAYRIDRMREAPLLSTSFWAIFCGLISGALLSLVSEVHVQEAGLDPQILFLGLLPPIILEAGFNTQRKGFFSNFMAILLLAIVGTLIATFVTGGVLIWLGSLGLITQLSSAEAFLYGSLISAIDPVATLLVFKKCRAPSLLFNLVFGESVLNDAVAIVIFTIFQKFVNSGTTDVNFQVAMVMVLHLISIGIGSVALSGAICYSSAFFLKHSDPALQQHPIYEMSIILLSCYASYFAADLFGLSGLLAVFFSGVFIRHYHMYNISKASAFAFTQLLATLSFLSENFIYLYLGLSVFAYRDSFVWDWGFVFANFGACLLARAFNTFPLCSLANCGRSEKQKIPFGYMIVIWFSGLRGAIAFALVLNVSTGNPLHAAILKSSTLFMVLFTTVFFGMATGPMLRCLRLTGGELPSGEHVSTVEDDEYAGEADEQRPLVPALLSPPGSQSVHSRWVDIDEKYLKPIFGGKPRTRTASDMKLSSHADGGHEIQVDFA
ncbi:Sodium/hydrogen exchanger 3 [Phytophthora boehmeriae]|uniref:Sodium/hydrogen exchanger n=1 Tax=Phytophthora boehmeriae TaxID=109152 RepID=A0A8T1X0J6_9STRA|nr:Sodium/hydrogen exchanger 3 [Phytophthora boehmeriae]